MKEVWRDIPGYEECYQASNFGNIKNLQRFIKRSRGGLQKLRETVLKPHNNKFGYLSVGLSINGIQKTYTVHKLVMLAFVGKSSLVIDHINGIKTDNRITNLRYCTQRENTTSSNVKKGNKFTGVSLNSPNYTKRYRARIRINGKQNELGSYMTPEEAHQAWKTANEKLIKESKIDNKI
jgi:hypothetical protein